MNIEALKTLPINQRKLRLALRPRARDSHKGDFGHALIVGGDIGMAGAALMAAEACARTGAGKISVATHREHIPAFVARKPELMAHGVESAEELQALLSLVTVVVIGPGLGQSDWSKVMLETVLASDLPLVVDADALNLLAANSFGPQDKTGLKSEAKLQLETNPQPETSLQSATNPQPETKLQSEANPQPEMDQTKLGKKSQRNNWILTPHPGEAARLLNTDTQQIAKDRPTHATRLQQQVHGVAVLKGMGSLIATPDALYQCKKGNPGMASGGMGDVLSGIIGGLLAQGFSLEDAACFGVELHASAADIAAKQHGERGLLATDLLVPLRVLLNP